MYSFTFWMMGDDRKLTELVSLTHNQTRFLMSEFTRQAHPDAAHRERLSKEIPGLTPRQVQVWFQNRFVFLVMGLIQVGG